MNINRILSTLSLLAFVIVLYSKGIAITYLGDEVTISIRSYTLLSWPLFLISAISSLRSIPVKTDKKASWFRSSGAFILDITTLFNLLFIPVAFILLVKNTGHFPPPWTYSGIIQNTQSFYILFISSCFFLWAGLGLALSPRIVTPGQLLFNVNIRVENHVTAFELVFLGIFAYYGMFIPMFNVFAGRLKAVKNLRE